MNRQDAIDLILSIVDGARPPVAPALVPAPASSSPDKKGARIARGRTSSPSSSGEKGVDDAPKAGTSTASVFSAPVVSLATKEAPTSQTGEPPKSTSGGKGGGKPHTPEDDVHALNLRLAWLPRTDLGNIERFRERYRGKLLYCDTLPGATRSEGGWLWWDGRRWSATAAAAKVKLYEHLCVRGIQDEAKACEKEAERLQKAHPDAFALAKKNAKAAAKKDTGKKKGPRLVAENGVLVDDAPEAKSKKPPDDKKIAGKILQLWTLSGALKSWGRQSEANSKMVPLSRQAVAYLGIEQGQLDADQFAFNVLNGTLMFRRQWDAAADPTIAGHEEWQAYGDYIKFKPHYPDDLMTKMSPVEFKAGEGCPEFHTFLARVQPEHDMRRFLQVWKGYQMTGDTTEARVLIYQGRGRNGKGVFETATGHVLGDYAGSTPIETFTVEARSRSAGQATPELAKLPRLRSLRSSEPKKGAQLDEALIKLVTGGDPIDARHLNRPFFTFLPDFKLTISTNPNLIIKDTSEGMWARVTKCPWSVVIPEDERDLKLGDKLKAEAAGILNWMLDGLALWFEKGLKLPETVRAATAEYRRDSDQLGRFLEDCCAIDAAGVKDQSRAGATALLELHNAWAKSGGGSEWRVKGMHDALIDRGFSQIKSNGMFWLGIKLLKTVNDFVDHEGKPFSSGSAQPSKHTGGGDDDDEIAF